MEIPWPRLSVGVHILVTDWSSKVKPTAASGQVKHLAYVKEQSLLISKNRQSREGRAGVSDKLANRNQAIPPGTQARLCRLTVLTGRFLLSAQIHSDDTAQPVRPRHPAGFSPRTCSVGK